MERLIKVRGTGRASQSPDQIEIQMSIVAQRFVYDEALNTLNQRTEILKQDLVQIGFKKEDIKTTRFTVETVYRYENERRIFDGYKATHDLKLTFDFDKVLLNQTLSTLSTSKSKPSFDVQFTIKDQEPFKNKILADALENAKQSADVIADTLGVTLGEIMEVNYDFEDRIFRSNLRIQEAVMLSADSQIDIDPEEVEQTEEVSVWWDIRTPY